MNWRAQVIKDKEREKVVSTFQAVKPTFVFKERMFKNFSCGTRVKALLNTK